MVNRVIRFLILPTLVSALVAGCSDDTGGEQESLEVVMFQVTPTGDGPTIGKVYIHAVDDNGKAEGVNFQPALHDLPPGEHGFHVHENFSCGPGEKEGKPVAALAAGGHYDPQHSGHHDGPHGSGHLGDLPALVVDQYGNAVTPVEAPRLSLSELQGHTLVIHAGPDNYTDNPPLGGGGARIACGIIN